MIIISNWSEIIIDVPRGSILGLFLLNIFLTDLFLIVKDTDNASYTDDSILLTLYLIMELQYEQWHVRNSFVRKSMELCILSK